MKKGLKSVVDCIFFFDSLCLKLGRVECGGGGGG